MLAKKYLGQITDITSFLIGCNLSVSQNFPSLDEQSGVLYLAFCDNMRLSIAQKNITFSEIYDVLVSESNYNIKMIDGGLFQFSYLFDLRRDVLLKHRLAYFPSPYLQSYQNDQELYEMDELYADVIKRNILPVPVRFDYDPRVNEGKAPEIYESIHPHSHVTFGQYENCRIAVTNYLSPLVFTEFILKSFYGTFYYNNIFRKEKLFEKHEWIEHCISNFETESMHLAIQFQH